MTTKLTRKESWDGEHPSELALSCLADGQLDVVDPDVRSHTDGCTECTLRIGELAIESHAVGAALAPLRTADTARAAAKHRFPIPMIAAAAAVALACGAPALLDGLPRTLPWVFAAPRIVPLLTASAVALAHDFSTSPIGRTASVASAALLCLIGFGIARVSRASLKKV